MTTANQESASLSVVVPAYNEEDSVTPFYEAVTQALDGISSARLMEIIFVNDGSSDGTLENLRGLAASDPRVRVIGLSRNFGHQAALTAGLAYATGDAVITMDCDLQDPPEIIPQMVNAWKKGSKIVYARRRARVDTPFKKITASAFYRILGRLSDVNIPRQVADFRLMDRVVVRNLLRLGEQARYLRGMVAWLGFEPAFVDFDRPDRVHGETHYPLMKMVRFAMDGLLSFSLTPLKLALWVGVLTVLAALAFLTYMVVDVVQSGNDYPLFKWLMVLLFGYMGAHFILIWIVGEYIGRIYNDVRRRPLYVVDEEVNFDSAHSLPSSDDAKESKAS